MMFKYITIFHNLKKKKEVMVFHKRTMYRSAVNKAVNSVYMIPKRSAFYCVESSNYKTCSPELAKQNPILGRIDKTFQHPNILSNHCADDNCPNRLCKQPCGPVTESAYVGFGTHDGNVEGATYLGPKDFDNNLRPQYGKFFEHPILKDFAAQTKPNPTLTTNLNSEPTTLENVHMKSSKLKQPISNDTNIQDIHDSQNIN